MVERVVMQGEPAAGPMPPIKPPEPTKPEIPEKFRKADGTLDGERVLASYQELERKQGTPKDPAASAAPVVPPVAPKDPAASPLEAKAPVVPAAPQAPATMIPGVTEAEMTLWGEEHAKTGALSEDSYKALLAKGYSKVAVDGWLSGQQATAELQRTKAFALTGGSDGYDSMLEWMSTEIPAPEIAAYNASMRTDVPAAAREGAIAGMFARFQAAGSQPAARRVSAGGGGGGVEPFASVAEMTAAMRDPRYKSGDKAYREQVAARVIGMKKTQGRTGPRQRSSRD